jgi:hypothetical protein
MPPPLPPSLFAGRYVTHVNDKLGPVQRLIPPLPPPTRFKKVGAGEKE